MADKKTGLELMREPFPEHQISKLPKPTKAQTDALREAQNKRDFSLGVRCKLCGQWHHKDTVHLDYVGHAALTDRLLECDINWNWEPAAVTETGAPALDHNGGMWIKLTVCGQTRLGYGDADGKSGGNAVKEVIGDALRNAAMRFGAALDLWHKGELHGGEPEAVMHGDELPKSDADADHSATVTRLKAAISTQPDAATLDKLWSGTKFQAALGALPDDMKADVQKAFTDRQADLFIPGQGE